jgi:hypothetical protein
MSTPPSESSHILNRDDLLEQSRGPIPPALRLGNVERFIRSCPDRLFVTLTTKRRLDSIGMSCAVRDTMNRVNRALYGTLFSRKRSMCLATLAVQERSFRQGLHTHMLVGVPEGSLALKANTCLVPVDQLIIRTWVAGDEPGFRSHQAQDAREISDFSGVNAYILKTVRSLLDLDNVDYVNTTYPDVL